MIQTRQSSRKRFPKWLYDLIEEGKTSGVYWLDKQKLIFRVPWTRVDSPDFDLAKDAMLFQRWAEFTGRYRVGERTDPSVWKTRFRCAIRKMSEIEELTVPANLEDKNGNQPFRVFRFTKEVTHISKRKDTRNKVKKRCNKAQRPKNPHSPSVRYAEYRSNRSRVTRQDMVRDTTESVTQGWVNQDVMTHGIRKEMTQMLPRDMESGVTLDGLHRCVTTDRCVPANEIAAFDTKEKYWPIINATSIRSHSSSYEITVSDLSLQQHVIGLTPTPQNSNRACVTMDSSFGYSNSLCRYDIDELASYLVNSEMTRECDQPYLPRISLQEVNSVLQSCSYPQAQYQLATLEPASGINSQALYEMRSFNGEDVASNLSDGLLKLGLSDDDQDSKACGNDLSDLTEILGLNIPSNGDTI